MRSAKNTGMRGRIFAALAALPWILAPALAMAQASAPPPAPAPASAAPAAYALLASIQGLETSLAAIPPQSVHVDRRQRAQYQAEVAAIERNVSQALPGLAQAVERSPQDVGLAFRFYRDAEAIYQVALRAGDVVERHGGRGEGAVLAANLTRVGQQLDGLAQFIQVRGSALSAAAARAAAVPPPPRELAIPNANAPARRETHRRHPRHAKHKKPPAAAAPDATPHP